MRTLRIVEERIKHEADVSGWSAWHPLRLLTSPPDYHYGQAERRTSNWVPAEDYLKLEGLVAQLLRVQSKKQQGTKQRRALVLFLARQGWRLSELENQDG